MTLKDGMLIGANAPGSMGAVCVKNFWKHRHGDCPFKMVCTMDNNPQIAPAIKIVPSLVTADILRAMADAIDKDLQGERMAITGNDDDGYTMSCDHCEEELNDGEVFDSWSEASEARKAAGWLTGKGKKSQNWFNLCTECREDREIREKFFED